MFILTVYLAFEFFYDQLNYLMRNNYFIVHIYLVFELKNPFSTRGPKYHHGPKLPRFTVPVNGAQVHWKRRSLRWMESSISAACCKWIEVMARKGVY